MLLKVAKKSYLGDGVYVEWNGYDIVLTTATNTIHLEPTIINDLIVWARKFIGDSVERNIPREEEKL
jgi:hypothetical protein